MSIQIKSLSLCGVGLYAIVLHMTTRKNLPLTLLIVFLLLLSFGVGFGLSQALSRSAHEEVPPEFNTLWEVWESLSKDYVNKEALDPKKLTQGAIKGLIEALGDPYTAYLDPETYELAWSSIEGSFEGIGAVVSMEDGELTVVSPIRGTPAEQQGIRAGDRILEIDGEATSGMTLTEAVLKIRGPKGTAVTLLIRHQRETEPVEVELIRAEINLDSVYLEMLPGDIAHIEITYFSLRTDQEVSSVLSDALSRGATAIIVDLRGNPGGLLDTVVNVADEFLDGGTILYQADDEGNVIAEWKASSGGLATDLPLAVLVDGSSASGSEVLAGALQDHGRAPLIGTQTYGKGSVQLIRELSDGSALYVTTARWLTPNGHLIEGQGLTPDFEVPITEEDIAQGIDPQLERAIVYIQTELESAPQL
jgi:carboxyl-terminal processing protease